MITAPDTTEHLEALSAYRAALGAWPADLRRALVVSVHEAMTEARPRLIIKCQANHDHDCVLGIRKEVEHAVLDVLCQDGIVDRADVCQWFSAEYGGTESRNLPGAQTLKALTTALVSYLRTAPDYATAIKARYWTLQ